MLIQIWLCYTAVQTYPNNGISTFLQMVFPAYQIKMGHRNNSLNLKSASRLNNEESFVRYQISSFALQILFLKNSEVNENFLF